MVLHSEKNFANSSLQKFVIWNSGKIIILCRRLGLYHENQRYSEKLILGTNVPGNENYGNECSPVGLFVSGNERSWVRKSVIRTHSMPGIVLAAKL